MEKGIKRPKHKTTRQWWGKECEKLKSSWMLHVKSFLHSSETVSN